MLFCMWRDTSFARSSSTWPSTRRFLFNLLLVKRAGCPGRELFPYRVYCALPCRKTGGVAGGHCRIMFLTFSAISFADFPDRYSVPVAQPLRLFARAAPRAQPFEPQHPKHCEKVRQQIFQPGIHSPGGAWLARCKGCDALTVFQRRGTCGFLQVA